MFLFGLGLFSLLLRLPFIPQYFYHSDSILFYQALDNFNPALSQPQPPGYILYIYLAKVVNFFLADGRASLLLLTLVASAVAPVMFYLLAKKIIGGKVGVVSSLLFAVSPLFWFYSELALAYVPEIAFALATLYFAYTAHREKSFWRLIVFSLLYALLGGLRQQDLLFLLPLYIFVLLPFSWRRRAVSIFIAVSVVVAWLLPMMYLAGGAGEYFVSLVRQYQGAIERKTVFVAAANALQHNFSLLGQTIYLLLGRYAVAAAGLLLLLFFIFRKKSINLSAIPALARMNFFFILLWALPLLLFSLFIHFNVYGHLALLYPLPFLLGGWLIIRLSRALAKLWRVEYFLIAGLTLLFALLLVAGFLSPSHGLAARLVEHDQLLGDYFSAVRENFSPDDTLLIDVCFSQELSSRHALYYLPDYLIYEKYKSYDPFSGKWRFIYFWHERTDFSEQIEIPFTTRNIVFCNDCATGLSVGERESDEFAHLSLDNGRQLPYYKMENIDSPEVKKDLDILFGEESYILRQDQ